MFVSLYIVLLLVIPVLSLYLYYNDLRFKVEVASFTSEGHALPLILLWAVPLLNIATFMYVLAFFISHLQKQ